MDIVLYFCRGANFQIIDNIDDTRRPPGIIFRRCFFGKRTYFTFEPDNASGHFYNYTLSRYPDITDKGIMNSILKLFIRPGLPVDYFSMRSIE